MKQFMLFIGCLLLVGLVLGCTSETPVEVVDAPEEQVEQPIQPEETVEEVTETPVVEETQPITSSGLYLITDKENSRVIEVKADGEVTWMFGCTSVNDLGYCSYGSGDKLLNKPQFATYIGNNVLITDKENNRIIEVDRSGDIIWEYGGTSGFDANELNHPNSAITLENGDILIADGFNHRIIELDDGEIVWQYGCRSLNSAGKCAYGTDDGYLRNPNYAMKLDNGNVLITDTENNRILEVTEDQETVWIFKSGLNIPQSAYRTEDGTTIIANYRNNNIIEVNQEKEVISEYKGLSIPTFAIPTEQGNLLVTDSYNNRIVELDKQGEVLTEINNTIEESQPLFPLLKPQAAVFS